MSDIISSKKHPLVKHLFRLKVSAQARKSFGETFIFGKHLLQEWLGQDRFEQDRHLQEGTSSSVSSPISSVLLTQQASKPSPILPECRRHRYSAKKLLIPLAYSFKNRLKPQDYRLNCSENLESIAPLYGSVEGTSSIEQGNFKRDNHESSALVKQWSELIEQLSTYLDPKDIHICSNGVTKELCNFSGDQPPTPILLVKTPSLSSHSCAIRSTLTRKPHTRGNQTSSNNQMSPVATKATSGAKAWSEADNHLCGPLLILDRLQDPGNVGTLLRTCDAAGITTCLLTYGSCDPYAPKVMASGRGSHFRMNIKSIDPKELLELIDSGSKRVIVADPSGMPLARFREEFPSNRQSFLATKSCAEERCLSDPLNYALVIGHEGHGPSKELLDRAAERGSIIRLPMREGVDSLNAAIAGSILIYALQGLS